MPFAETEAFWKSPNVFDVLSLVGLAVGFISIWLAIIYSKRDLTTKIAEAETRASEAAREEIRRIAQELYLVRIAELIRILAMAREACRAKAWARSCELCEQAREDVISLLSKSGTGGAPNTELDNLVAVLLECIEELRRKRESGTGKVPEGVYDGITESIHQLRRLEGRLSGLAREAGQ